MGTSTCYTLSWLIQLHFSVISDTVKNSALLNNKTTNPFTSVHVGKNVGLKIV